MSDKNVPRLSLLLFSVGGIHFAVDAEQVAEISIYDDEQSDELCWFHEELAYGASAVRYSSPTVLSIKTVDAPSYRVIIDSMEDVAEFSPHDLQLFPALLERLVMRQGLWGILPRNGIMVFLIDFQRLQRNKVQRMNLMEVTDNVNS